MRPRSSLLTLCLPLVVAASLSAATATTPRLRWEHSRDLDGRSDDVVDVALSGRRVVVLGNGRLQARGREFDTILRVHHAASGRLLWERVLDDEDLHFPGALATQGGRRVFVGGLDGSRIRAFASATGRELWTADVEAGRQGAGEVAVLAVRHPLVIAAGAWDEGGGSNLRIVALRTRDGEIVWDHLDDEGGGNGFTVAATVVGDRLYVLHHRSAPDALFGQRLVDAYDVATGERLWRHELPASEALDTRLAAGDFRVFVAFRRDVTPRRTPGGESLEVRALDADTGAIDWVFERDLERDDLHFSFRPQALLAAGPRLFLSGGQEPFVADQVSTFVIALGAVDGELLWEDTIRDPDLDHGSAPDLAATARELVAVMTVRGSGPAPGDQDRVSLVRSYAARTGRLRWEIRGPGADGALGADHLLLARRDLVVAGCRPHARRPHVCDIGVAGYRMAR